MIRRGGRVPGCVSVYSPMIARRCWLADEIVLRGSFATVSSTPHAIGVSEAPRAAGSAMSASLDTGEGGRDSVI